MEDNSKFSNVIEERLYNIWLRKNPKYEIQYEGDESNPGVIRILTDYGKAASKKNEERGKVLGPGYESYILAFFIGLYSGRKLSLTQDSGAKKDFNWAIENWTGNDRGGRSRYEDLRSYIFIALVAKTEIDWLALDEGKIEANEVANKLIKTMEEYANYGYYVMADKLKDRAYFYSNRSFLDLFLEIVNPPKKESEVKGPGPI